MGGSGLSLSLGSLLTLAVISGVVVGALSFAVCRRVILSLSAQASGVATGYNSMAHWNGFLAPPISPDCSVSRAAPRDNENGR